MKLLILLMCLLTACGHAQVESSIQLPRTAPNPFAQYAERVAQIVQTGRVDRGAHQKLTELCDDIGCRLSGSQGLENAVQWALASLKRDGLANVHAEPVTVQKWVRGSESLQLLEPRMQTLAMLGLGSSVATPLDGITAQVVVAHTEKELETLGERVRGKIVLFDNPMPQWTPESGAQYGETVRFRVHGPTLAAKHGAVAVLVRSVTARSLTSPHTGNTHYEEGVGKIPAAALSVEHSALLARLVAQGKNVVVKLRMDAHLEGQAQSANVIADLPGREPDEIVIVSGHLDSWDVGQGAHDDGAGVVMAMQAVKLLKSLGMTPRRTIRVVLWTNEENGLAGGKAYAQQHAGELDKHVAAIEADSGAFRPEAIGIELEDKTKQAQASGQLAKITELFSGMKLEVHPDNSGADVGPMRTGGVPLLGLIMESSTYFDYHHTQADTLDKVDPALLAEGEALFAGLAWLLAEWPGRLGERL